MIPVSYTHLDVYKGQVMDRTRILMASRDKSYFMDGGKLEVEKDKVLKQLEQLHKLLRRQQDNCQTYFQDMEFLHSFILTYHQPFYEKEQELLSIQSQAEKNQQESIRLKEENSRMDGEVRQAKESCQTNEERLNGLEQELDDYVNIQKISVRLRQVQQLIKEKEGRIGILEQEHGKIKADIMNSKTLLGEYGKRQQHFTDLLKGMESQWEDVYKPYYVEGSFDTVELAGESLDSRFAGLKDAYEKEHLDLEDKKALIQSYEASMERCLNAIHVRNSDIEMLSDLKKKNELVWTDREELSNYRQELAQLSAEIKEMRQELEREKANKNRLFGKVSQSISAVEEKYGNMREVSVEETGYENFIRDYEKSLSIELGKLEKAEGDIEKGQKEIRYLEDVKRDLERLVRSLNVPFGRTKETYPLDINLRKKYDEIVEYNERDVYKRQNMESLMPTYSPVSGSTSLPMPRS